MANSRFKISKFTNPSGNEVWRLSGTLNGQRIRQNFRSRSEAVAERQRLDIRHLNESSEGQTIFTTLTQDQNKDAIAAISLLNKSGFRKSLTFAVDYFISHYSDVGEAVEVSDAIQLYRTAKGKEVDREIITARQFRSISHELDTLERVFADRNISDITAKDLIDYLEGKQAGSRYAKAPKTWNNRLWYLSSFFKFCLKEKLIAENPVVHVHKFEIKKARSTAETLSADQAKDLMGFLESYRGKQNKNQAWWGNPGCMVPYFALTLFAGIRPDWKYGEISKLSQKDIRFDTDIIRIEPSASKVNEMRTIYMQPNLRLWLERYPLDSLPICGFKRFEEMLIDIRKQWRLPHDVLRHTYISMTVGAFRSVGDAALQAGNSEAIIRKHYLNLKSITEADEFWRIVPQGMTLPHDLEKKDGRYVVAPGAED